MTPWITAHKPPCPSPAPGVHSNSCSLSRWCHSTISSSLPPSLPAFNLSQHQGLFQWVSSSPTQRTWVWASSGRWWRTGKLGVLQYVGSQRVGHDWTTEQNWIELNWTEQLVMLSIFSCVSWPSVCLRLLANFLIGCLFLDSEFHEFFVYIGNESLSVPCTEVYLVGDHHCKEQWVIHTVFASGGMPNVLG